MVDKSVALIIFLKIDLFGTAHFKKYDFEIKTSSLAKSHQLGIIFPYHLIVQKCQCRENVKVEKIDHHQQHEISFKSPHFLSELLRYWTENFFSRKIATLT